MQDLNFNWLIELGLQKDDFSDLPKDENPLIWALKNQIVQEEAFTVWSSSYHQIPAIKPEFFSLAIDFTLLEKFSKLHQWNEACYPIYLWEDTLFIACLEPIELNTTHKVCFVAAPFSAMAMAWNNHTEVVPEILTKSAIYLPDLDLTVDLPPLPPIDEPVSTSNASSDKKDNIKATEAPKADLDSHRPKNIDLVSIDSLDFSNLDEIDTEKESNTQVDLDIPKIESTEIDQKINNLTTATETIHSKAEESEIKDLPLPDLDFKEISTDSFLLENDPQEEVVVEKNNKKQIINDNIKPKNIDKQTISNIKDEDTNIPTLSNLITKKSNSTEEMPQLETNSHIDNKSSAEDIKQKNFDDDYTPLPFLSKENRPATNQAKFLPTDPGSPFHETIPIPSGHKITDTELKIFSDLNEVKDLKSVCAHIFFHLKNDYKKLLWVEEDDSQFKPKYAWGQWAITTPSWDEEIDLTHPNIFRIAHRSRLPYHGKIQPNPFNDKIFEKWNGGQTPSFATIVPVIYNEVLYGYIVGFSQGNLFDPVQSLKKIENLTSIVKPSFLNFQNKKAS